MARPIVWQDIGAPQFGGALAASAAAGEQITRALSGIGDVARNYVDTTRGEATRAAVADIMNAADPMAAARAAPDNWKIDPLAIQKAAQAQDQVIRGNLASDAQLAASEISTQMNQAQYDDLISTRKTSQLAAPLIRQMQANKGAMPEFDINAPEWQTPEGNKAYSMLLGEQQKWKENARQEEELQLRREAVVKGKEKEDLERRKEKFKSEVQSLGKNPAGLLMAPEERFAAIEAAADRWNVPRTEVMEGAKYFQFGLDNNKPTAKQLDTPAFAGVAPAQILELDANKNPVAKPLTYKGALKVVNQAEQKIAAKRDEVLNSFSKEIPWQDLAKPSRFAGMDRGAIQATLAKEHDNTRDNIGQQMTAFQVAAKELDPNAHLDDDQAALLVDRFKGDEGFAGTLRDSWIAKSEKAQTAIKQLLDYNRNGKLEGFTRQLAAATAKQDRQLTDIARQRDLIGAASQQNLSLPDGTIELINTTNADFRAASAAQKAKAAQPVPKVKKEDLEALNRILSSPSYGD